MSNIQDITTDEFEALLKEQSQFDTKKWTDLEINNIYTVFDAVR